MRSSSHQYTSVYGSDVAEWRKALKVKDDTKILVAFAWCHDEELRLARMFPEFFACDTTFGVTKEQRNLFLFAGVDGNNKAFPLLHCFMPSKEVKAYSWVMNVALPYLVTTQTLSLNQCISSDAEIGIYAPLRGMMESVPCLNKSSHRLDKYHLFTKPWNETVVLKLSTDESIREKVQILNLMMSKLFDYVETIEESNETIKHYRQYYASIKDELKSEIACKGIEAIDTAITNNIKYISHYHFKDIATFGFLGDSIVEAVNSSIKNPKSYLHVSTNMRINKSAATQIQISNCQTRDKNK